MQLIPENHVKDFFKLQSVSTKIIEGTDDITFYNNDKTNVPVILQLFDDRVEFYYRINENFSNYPNYILLKNDFIGTTIRKEENTKKVYLIIHAYPRKNYFSQTYVKNIFNNYTI